MSSMPAFLGRLSWMIVGPFAQAIVANSISERRDGWVSPLDLFYFVVPVGMLMGRWLEFRSSRPLTATGEPADGDHLHRYAWGLGLLGLAGWVAANLVGNQVIRILG
jgi:hypothetical protein